MFYINKKFIFYFFVFYCFTYNICVHSFSLPLLTSNTDKSHTTYSANIEILILMTLLSLAPSILITMSCFLRISIVLALFRQALGVSQTPSNQILIGISLFLTLFIMSPTISIIEKNSVTPFLDNKINFKEALTQAGMPMRNFMLNQTRKDDLNFFFNLSHGSKAKSREEISFTILIPAFITSELETAFQIGFMLFIPFLIIDLLVSSILMALGMMMVSPMVISLPLKIVLFVIINGWHLIFKTLAGSFFQS